MTSGTPILIEVAHVDSQSLPKNTSVESRPSPADISHSSHSSSRPTHSCSNNNNNNNMDDPEKPVLDTTSSGHSLGQFSFAPATQTTVVTTTTTTTTSFPPLVIKPPRAANDLDPKLYPLASSPTPASLRNFKFDLGGKSVIFNEPEDTVGAVNELNEKNAALRSSNGVVRSVASFATPDNTNSRRVTPSSVPNQLSSQSTGLKRRPVSPVSIPEIRQGPQRSRSSRVLSEPASRWTRSQASTTHPAVPGMATPEADINLRPNGGLSRRRIHSASLARRETHLHSPLSSEVESQPSQTANSKPSENEPQFTRSFEAGRHAPSPGKRAALRSAAPENNEHDEPENAAASQETQPVDPSSQLTSMSGPVSQDMCLPSPSLSPVAAMNAGNVDSSFDSAEDPGIDTDSTVDNNGPRFPRTLRTEDSGLGESLSSQTDNMGVNAGAPQQPASLMDIPVMLDFFDSAPDELKTYLMYQFLRRCPKPTLHVVADVVNPALKCDFLALLPLELSLDIVKHLDVQSMCRAAQVSKKWRQIVNSDEKTWKAHFDKAGYVLPDGELERAIKEGWAWQFPNGNEDWEKDLSTSASMMMDQESAPMSSLPSSSNVSGDRVSSVSRRTKRKASTRGSTRKYSKRKTSSRSGHSDSSDWRKEIATSEGPYAAANAAAAAVPYPDVGLPSLRGLHLYKSLYQRHQAIRKSWMKPNVRPSHIAFRAHDRHVVTCLQFDTDKILTGSDDTNINVYGTKTGALRATLEGHEGGVWALEYYGNTLVSGSTDRSVRVWDIERARCTQIFQGHTSTVRCLQIVLPVEVGKRSDGSPEMMPKEPLIITGSRDSSLRVWKLPKPGDPDYYQGGPLVDDIDCPYFVRVLTGHQHSVRAIAAHGDTLVSGSYDSTVRVWKISTGETIHRLHGHTMKVYSVVLDHKRNRCISGSMDNMVKIWSLETGSLLYNLEGHTSLVGLLDLQSDRLVSAAADSTLRIWDPETGQCKSMLSAHTGAITCFQHDGQKVISGSDRTLKMWDVRTGECVRDLLTDLSGVWQVKFDGRRCVAAVQRESMTYIEVLDFGASRDGVPPNELGRRILVNHHGQETTDEEYDLSDA